MGVGVGVGATGGVSGVASGGVVFPGGGAETMVLAALVGLVGVCGDLLQAATVASTTNAEAAEM